MTDSKRIEILITIPFAEPLLERLHGLSKRFRISVIPARKVDEVPSDTWKKVEILYTDSVLPLPEIAPSLRWVQLHYAGLDDLLKSPLLSKPGIEITHLSGAAAPQMAEYILMMLLGLAHRLPDLAANQLKTEWPKDRWERFLPIELRGSTVGIIGYGSIGRELARLLQPFHVKLLAVKRDLRHPEDAGYNIDGLGDPGGDLFSRLYPVEALQSLVKECDFIVICLPLTRVTQGLIDENILKAVKPGAYLVDVGRGGIIHQAALLSALQEKRLAGAALDVFSEEPLPPSHPFWRMPNVIVTPHVAGISPAYRERAVELFATNLERYLQGETLLNRFNPENEY